MGRSDCSKEGASEPTVNDIILNTKKGLLHCNSFAKCSSNSDSRTTRGYTHSKRPHVKFSWIPAHANVEGNEKADSLARSVTTEGAGITPSSMRVAPRALSKIKELSFKHCCSEYLLSRVTCVPNIGACMKTAKLLARKSVSFTPTHQANTSSTVQCLYSL